MGIAVYIARVGIRESVNCSPFRPDIGFSPRAYRHKPGKSGTFSKVDVARRRRFSTDRKLAVVAETMQPGMSIGHVARRRGLQPGVPLEPRMSEGGREAARADDEC